MKAVTKTAVLKKLTLIGVFVIGLSLIVSAIVMFANHSSEILERSYTEATNNSLVAKSYIEGKVNNYVNLAASSAGTFDKVNDQDEVALLVLQIKNNDELASYGLSNVRYFNKDKAYSAESKEIVVNDDLAIEYRKQETTKATYLGINLNSMHEIDPEQGKIQLYEFYAPINTSYYIDGISLYFSTYAFRDSIGNGFINKNAVISSMCSTSGMVLSSNLSTMGMSIIDELASRIGNAEPTKLLSSMLAKKESGVIAAKVNGVNHVISVQCNAETLRDICVVEFYECSVLAKSTTDFINAIVAVIVIFIVILIAFSSYFIINHFRLQRKINNSENYDLKMECLNRHGFEKETDQILARENGLYFAVIVMQIRHFKFLKENYGEAEINSLLNYLKVVLVKTCKIEEIYGYQGEDEFLILLHAKNREDLVSRLKIHSFLSTQYKGSNKFDVAIKYGIYEHMSNEKIAATKMIDFANEANNAITKSTVENVDMQFNFYDQNLRKIRLLNEDMELRQETALKEGEFQVFYQAKYNLNTHKQDGAEALVRWYDPNTGEYNKPALFMPLFESNGFIEKLDKYVYTKVCEYISYSLADGRNVFPVSVNVSRITATQPDFVDFYVKTKKKYGIANGALTIEFTESFAYENYDVLKDIVNRLHKNGFKTSIDDFGCGYSSYRILKELPMDEIKLDKFFIDRAEDPERIDFIYQSVIALAKNLKMKVTQEGVERQEDVELLKQHGCDVIQGYIYSHPLSLTDYLFFVEHTKEHNL